MGDTTISLLWDTFSQMLSKRGPGLRDDVNFKSRLNLVLGGGEALGGGGVHLKTVRILVRIFLRIFLFFFVPEVLASISQSFSSQWFKLQEVVY